MVKSKSPMRAHSWLTNRYVLFFIFALTLGNIIQLVTNGDFVTVTILVLVGFITSCFSKNMICILITALVVANVLKYGTDISNPWIELEGFASGEQAEDTDLSKLIDADNDEDDEDKNDTEDEDLKDEDEEEEGDEEEEEAFTTTRDKNKRRKPKTKKQKMIEKDALEDLRAEMKIGFKRLNQNIDSMNMANFFA